jgi:hypothetical protein
MTFALRALLALLLGATVTGCSSFQREWERAAATGPANLPKGMTGRWAGQWESDKNHHRGELRCIVTEMTNGLYSARFHARYKRVFNLTFGYTVVLEARARDDGFDFHGTANLGWYAGGTYEYKGFATATNFHSSYSCKYDHGLFQMTRPSPNSEFRIPKSD